MAFSVAPRVRAALDEGLPVVALESTVVTHGLPRPDNLTLARGLEATVREAGGEPATVGVLDGTVVVGLEDDDLVRLAEPGADKASTWNLAALVAHGRDAGTTVATTLYAAQRAGIETFATGGIGGVHPGGGHDESADLAALARTPLVTVCAGPKSLLDAAATLERLETSGVAVVGYGADHLAGFHVATTDLRVPARADDPATVARIKRAQDALGQPQALLLAQPVDPGLDADAYAGWLRAAYADADAAGITGRDATPFLLDALARHSNGATVDVNLRLLHANAALATRVAAALTSTPTGGSA